MLILLYYFVFRLASGTLLLYNLFFIFHSVYLFGQLLTVLTKKCAFFFLLFFLIISIGKFSKLSLITTPDVQNPKK